MLSAPFIARARARFAGVTQLSVRNKFSACTRWPPLVAGDEARRQHARAHIRLRFLDERASLDVAVGERARASACERSLANFWAAREDGEGQQQAATAAATATATRLTACSGDDDDGEAHGDAILQAQVGDGCDEGAK